FWPRRAPGTSPPARMTIGTSAIPNLRIDWPRACRSRRGAIHDRHRGTAEEVPEGAQRRDRVADPSGCPGPGERAAVRLPHRQAPGAGRWRGAGRQAERPLPGAAQPGRGRPAGQPRRAVRRRSAAPLLPHHRRRPRGPGAVGRRLARHPRFRRFRPGGGTRMNATHGRPLPTTIPQYLEQLREALRGADPAMIQDALYDAEEYLRSGLAEQAGRDEAEVIASVAGSYGAPEEVAEIYRETEVTVNRALRPPRPRQQRSLPGRFFGVVADPYTYGALFYMLLSLATGVFYFSWVVTGASTSLGLLVLIIGVPLLLLFLLSVRLLSLVEGRIVEVLLGVRMPRRPLYTQRDKPWLTRIGELFT